MLKIKDNVNLKELEKFGFKKFQTMYFNEEKFIRVDNDTRKIWVASGYIDDLIYDIIKADLVENAEE